MDTDTWERVVALRTGLVAQAEAFTPDDWDAPSLCQGWRVRDVVAHLTLPERFGPFSGLGGLIRAGFRLDRYLHQDAVRRGSVPVTVLMTAYLAGITHRAVPPGRRPVNVLADLLIHLQDIRRPLGLAWPYDPDVLATVADTIHADTALGVTERVAGVRVRATDIPWAAGQGPEAAGPLEALILAMSGRPMALPELTGPGAETLASRVGLRSPRLPG